MAQGKRFSVLTTGATKILGSNERAVVTNQDATNSVDLGGSDVAAGSGYELKAGKSIDVISGADEVWAIADTATVRVDIIATRQDGN